MFECFKIQLLTVPLNASPFDIEKGKVLKKIDCLPEAICVNPTIIVADPFLFVRQGRLFLFYESKKLFANGVIMMTSTTDLKSWTEPIVVLEEAFHLSYPYVFMEGSQIYMIPETNADGSIRLYEAVDDNLTNWNLRTKLIKMSSNAEMKMAYSDSSIYKKSNIYYLMTTVQYQDDINTLELYYSNSLMGEYIRHPSSPIAHSQNVGRNAGGLQEIGGKLYRFSQNCVYGYGDNVNISEVLQLTTTEYKEHIIKEGIYSSKIPFYHKGGHQLSIVVFKDSWIVATDAKEYHRLLYARIMNRFKRFL